MYRNVRHKVYQNKKYIKCDLIKRRNKNMKLFAFKPLNSYGLDCDEDNDNHCLFRDFFANCLEIRK